jgi:hypothetical protein
MKAAPHIPDLAGLDEVLEQGLRELLERLGSLPIEDLEIELTTLSKLVEDYKRRDELLEGLLAPGTTEARRSEILEPFNTDRVQVTRSRAEIMRLHDRSHGLIQTSIRLLLDAQRKVYRQSNKSSEYAPEICGYCNGFGGTSSHPCLACDGRRTILVHQPPIPCPRCNGNGKPIAADRVMFFQEVCVVCRGKGWALVMET